MLLTDKLLFIHIPKTGGGAISSYMRKHLNAEQIYSTHFGINKEIYEKYKDRHIFSVVRNTHELLSSCYRWRHIIKDSANRPFIPFEQFVRQSVTLCSQLHYISIDGNVIPEVIDYDNIKPELGRIFMNNGYDYPELEKTKATHYHGKYDWTEYYTPEIIALVNKLYSEDIEHFNFTYRG